MFAVALTYGSRKAEGRSRRPPPTAEWTCRTNHARITLRSRSRPVCSSCFLQDAEGIIDTVSVRRFFHLQLPRTLLASQIGSGVRRGCPRRSNLVAGLFLPERLIAAAARLPRDRPARVLVARCVRPLPVLYEGIAKNVWELLWARAGSAGPVDPVRRPVDGRSHNLGRRGSPVLPAWAQGAHREAPPVFLDTD